MHLLLIFLPAKENPAIPTTVAQKIAAMGVIIVVSMVTATVPYLVTLVGGKYQCISFSRRALSLINCVITGFYLGLALLYFLAFSHSYLNRFTSKWDIELSYPIIEGLVCAGFMTVATIDAFVHHGSHVFIVDLASTSSSSNPNHVHVQRINVLSPGLKKFVTIFSVSIQTIVAGVALGLQEDMSEIFSLTVALSLYGGVVSFDIGNKLFIIYHNSQTKAVCWSLIFALSGPVGISIGITIAEMRERPDETRFGSGGVDSNPDSGSPYILVSGALMAIACGIFLHVTFINYERLKAPHQSYYNGFFRLLFVILGLLIISLLRLSSTYAFQDFKDMIFL